MVQFAVGTVSSRLVRKLFSILKLELQFPWFAFPISWVSVMFKIQTSCVYNSSTQCLSAVFPFSDDGDEERPSAI